jgi:hypothetical protein
MEVSMKTNENSGDRIIRILLALGLGTVVSLKLVTGITAIILVAAAGILLLTGAIGFCGIYALLGLSTCRIPKTPVV